MDLVEISQVLLWIVVLVMGFVVMALVHQIGVLHVRLAPAGALMIDKGVDVNAPAPQVTASDRFGRPVSVGYHGERAKLLFFMSPSCPVCKALLPAVKSLSHRYRDKLDVVYVSDGDATLHEAVIATNKLGDATYVVGPEIGMAYRIGKLPYAVLIDAEGVLRAKGLVNSREHLESLFEAWTTGYGSLQDYVQKIRTIQPVAR